MSKYLDKTGLSAFWQKIKDTFAKKSDIPTDYVNTTSAQDISGVKTFKDTFYLDASTPYIIGKKNKIGMRAVDSTTGSNVGQFAVSNSSWDAYNGHFATMQAFDSDGNGHAIRISYNGPAYRVDSVDHPLALTENHYTKTESDAKYLPTTGGSMTGNIYIPSDSGLLYEDGSGWGLNDAGEPCLLNKQGRFLLIATTEFYDDYISYRFPEKEGTVALTNDFKTINGQSIIGSGDITISGGGVSGDYLPLDGGGTISDSSTDQTTTIGAKEVTISSSMTGSSTGLMFNGIKRIINGTTYNIYFPEQGGTVALTSDVPHQHDIHFMSGTGVAANVYIWFTLINKVTTAYTSATAVASALYNRGNTERRNAVSATGRANDASTGSFAGSIVGVYAPSTSKIGVVYMNSSGTIGTAEYATSLLTSMRDKVN